MKKWFIGIGCLLIFLQISSMFFMFNENSSLFPDPSFSSFTSPLIGKEKADDTVNIAELAAGFKLGIKKYFKSFTEFFSDDSAEISTDEFVAAIISASLGAGATPSAALYIFDFSILLGYMLFGIGGIVFLIIGCMKRE